MTVPINCNFPSIHFIPPSIQGSAKQQQIQALTNQIKGNEGKIAKIDKEITAREKILAIKEVDKMESIIKDCKIYEKTLFNTATQKISIDLDDGVKVNYLKFKEVIVPIKGLEKVSIDKGGRIYPPTSWPKKNKGFNRSHHLQWFQWFYNIKKEDRGFFGPNISINSIFEK